MWKNIKHTAISNSEIFPWKDPFQVFVLFNLFLKWLKLWCLVQTVYLLISPENGGQTIKNNISPRSVWIIMRTYVWIFFVCLFICSTFLFPLTFFFKFLTVAYGPCKAVNFRVNYILCTSEHILVCKSHNHWLMLKFKEYYQEKSIGSFWRWTAFFVRLAYMQKEFPKLFSRQLGK